MLDLSVALLIITLNKHACVVLGVAVIFIDLLLDAGQVSVVIGRLEAYLFVLQRVDSVNVLLLIHLLLPLVLRLQRTDLYFLHIQPRGLVFERHLFFSVFVCFYCGAVPA